MKPIYPPVVAALFLLGALPVGFVSRAAIDPSLQLTLSRTSQNTVLTWFGSNAMAYQVEASSNLTAWGNVGVPLPGNNAMLATTNAATDQSLEFFRLRRMTVTVTAAYDAQTGILTITGDALPNIITVGRTGAGTIQINGGTIGITGGTPTVANTTLIQIFGLAGNDQLTLDETSGAMPRASMYGDADDDALTGGSGADVLNGGEGADVLFGKGGADILLGGDGDDTLTGGDADDQIYGEAGNDRLIWNPGDDTDLDEGGSETDVVEVNGGNGAEVFTVTANGTRVRFDRLDPAPFFLDIGTCEHLVLNANGGNDSISCTGNLAALIQIMADGGAGEDTLLGSNGADTLHGGDNNDFIDGQQGNDVVLLGAGDDVFQWDPGDGSDTVEGQDGADRLEFNGSAANEVYELTAVNSRVQFTRNIGSVILDLDGIETLDANALGGTDTFIVHSTTGTDLASVNVDLAGTLGGAFGDAAVDTVVVNGTAGADTVEVLGAATSASVLGLVPQVNIINSEGANDALVVNALGGMDALTATTLPSGVIKLTLDGGAGNDSLLGSQGADVFLGGDGDDFIMGDNGNDTAFMGADNDLFQWDPGDGSDTIEGQAGSDMLVFNGSNAAEIVDAVANGSRFLLLRNVGAVTLDCEDVEAVRVNALGGADAVNFGELTATDVTNLLVDLGSPSGSGTGDLQADTVVMNCTQTNDTVAVSGASTTVNAGGLSAALTIIGMDAANDTLTVNALGGLDWVDASGLASNVMKLVVNGGLGVDTIIGSQGNDIMTGGDGNDVLFGGPGDDTAVWNPGDDNDTVEGQAGADTLQFNGANVAENISLSANGGRFLLFRDVASVTADCNDVETVRFEALGGADNITVNSLAGTDVTSVNVNLAASGGGGDAQADNVIINGTSANDTVTVGQNNGVVVVAGLSTTVNLSGSEAANDRVTLNLLGGDDVLDASALSAGIIALTGNGGDHNDFLIGSGGADTLLGGAGNDTLIGGPGVDVLDGGTGTNTIIQD